LGAGSVSQLASMLIEKLEASIQISHSIRV
jgi:hypothetical protein